MIRSMTSVFVRAAWGLGVLTCIAVAAAKQPESLATFAHEEGTAEVAIGQPISESSGILPKEEKPSTPLVRVASRTFNLRNYAVEKADEAFKDQHPDPPAPEPEPEYYLPPHLKPKPKWTYREPTCTPSVAQIKWAKMLPNYQNLVYRGLSDEDIVAYLAPNEVKALEGDTVPEHLIPVPDKIYVNERCRDGTCTTGYCNASRRNKTCPLPR